MIHDDVNILRAGPLGPAGHLSQAASKMLYLSVGQVTEMEKSVYYLAPGLAT